MLLINSIKVMFSNLGTMWKILLYKLVMLLIFLGLFAAIVLPQIGGLVSGISGTGLFRRLGDLISYILRIEADLGPVLSMFNESLTLTWNILSNYVLAIILTVVIYLIYRFFSLLIDIPLTSVLETNLESCAKIPLIPTLFKNIKKSAKYSLWSLLIKFPSSILFIVIIYFVTQAIFSIFPMAALFLIMLLIIVFFAFRSTVFSMWRPVAVSGGNDVFSAFKKASKISFKKFWMLYTHYIIIYLSMIFVTIIITVFTFGVGLIVSIPLGSLLISIFQLIFYFSYNHKKYYLDGDTIIKARLNHSMPDLEIDENIKSIEIKE